MYIKNYQHIMPFDIDLVFGQRCEREIGQFLAKGRPIEYSVGNFKDYDYVIDGATTYEQKTDKLTRHTGNICVELLDNGKPSGILASKADYWVTYPLGMGEIAVVPRMKMMRIARMRYTKYVKCGDDNRCEGLLVRWKSIPNRYKIKYDGGDGDVAMAMAECLL